MYKRLKDGVSYTFNHEAWDTSFRDIGDLAVDFRGAAARRADYALLEKAFLDLLPVLIADPSIPKTYVVIICENYLNACWERYGDRVPGMGGLEKAVGKEKYQSDPVLLAVQGYHYKHAAWHGNVEIMRLLIDSGADINIVINDESRSILMGATQGGYTAAVKLLLEHGANPALKDKYGKTAFDIAREAENPELTSILKIE